jgi:hypothetical protein
VWVGSFGECAPQVVLDGILAVFQTSEMNNSWVSWVGAILLWSTLEVLFALRGLSSGNWSLVS